MALLSLVLTILAIGWAVALVWAARRNQRVEPAADDSDQVRHMLAMLDSARAVISSTAPRASLFTEDVSKEPRDA